MVVCHSFLKSVNSTGKFSWQGNCFQYSLEGQLLSGKEGARTTVPLLTLEKGWFPRLILTAKNNCCTNTELISLVGESVIVKYTARRFPRCLETKCVPVILFSKQQLGFLVSDYVTNMVCVLCRFSRTFWLSGSVVFVLCPLQYPLASYLLNIRLLAPCSMHSVLLTYLAAVRFHTSFFPCCYPLHLNSIW